MKYDPKIHHIHLKDIEDAAFVQRYCRRNTINFMVYALHWRNEILKYGIQHRVGVNQPGERIYTQIGWMPGWKNGTLTRSKATGNSVQKMINYIVQKYNVPFHKDDVSVTIMDYTDYPFRNTENIYAEMQNLEEHFKKFYFEYNGRFPIGNIKQERIRFTATEFENLFDFC